MERKKVIFQISAVANWASVGKDAEGIARAGKKRGYDCYVTYGTLYNKSEAHLYQTTTSLGQHINALKARLFDNEGLSAKASTKRLILFMKEVNPDVVILHNLHGYYLNFPLLFDYLRESKIPVIYSLHDCWAFTGHCTYFTTIGCEKWKTGCHHCPQRSTYPKSWFLDRSRRNYAIKKEKSCQLDKSQMAVVTVSDWLKGLVESSFLNKYPVYRIYNGIRTDIFKQCDGKSGLWPGKKVLIGCSKVWNFDDGDRKGLADYIKLSKILPDDYIILLVGKFTDKNDLKSLPSNIVNIDRTHDQKELAEYYSRADVLLNLSYMETMGLTSAEALACGTPCVVYNDTALPELITPQTGIVVTPGDINEVWNAVQKLVADGKEKYSEACRQRALDEFDEIKQFSKYVDLYEKLFKQQL